MQSRDPKGLFLPGGGMDEEIKQKISATQIKRKEEAREFGTPPDRKKCTGKCGQWLPVDAFPKRKNTLKSGTISVTYESRCLKCRKEHYAKYREENREKLRVSESRRYKKNRQKICKDARERYRMEQALAGRMVKPAQKYEDEIAGRLALVDVGPFVAWFTSLNGTTPTDSDMGDNLSRAVRRALNGEIEKMHLDIVDEVGVLVGMPHLIYTLYPHS